jgi:hypothetical protein
MSLDLKIGTYITASLDLFLLVCTSNGAPTNAPTGRNTRPPTLRCTPEPQTQPMIRLERRLRVSETWKPVSEEVPKPSFYICEQDIINKTAERLKIYSTAMSVTCAAENLNSAI